MSTAIKSSAIGLCTAFAILVSALGTSPAQARDHATSYIFENRAFQNSAELSRQDPAEFSSVVYPLPRRATVAYVEEQLRHMGFTHVTSVSRSGNIYKAEAIWDDRSVTLRIDGRNGRITVRRS